MIKWTFLLWLSVAGTGGGFFDVYHKTPRCLWHNNDCVDRCPDWMMEVKSDCSKTYWNAQKTCDNPETTLVGTVCGFSRCDCPDDMVIDLETGYCYHIDNCPTKHSLE